MYFIPYLFRKDLVRLKILILVWFLLILTQLALGIGGIDLAAEFLQFQMFLPLLTKMISILQGLMIIVIFPLLIQDDSLVGTTSFWFTRPISRKGLLITKACFTLILLIALPLIAEIFVLAANGAAGHHMLLAVPEILIEKMAFIVPFLILAVLTPKFSRYALVGIIIFAMFTVVGIIGYVIMMFLPNFPKFIIKFLHSLRSIYKDPSLATSIKMAKNVYVISIGSLLIAHQFLTRRTARTIKCFVVAYLVMMCLARVWPWDFLKEVSPLKSTATISDSLSVGFETKHVIIADEVRLRKRDARRKSVSVRQTVEGLPLGQFAILKRLKDVQMKYSDGAILKSGYVSTGKEETISNEKFTLPLQAVLKDIKLLNPFKEKPSYTEVFSLEKADFNLHKNRTGTYSAHAEFDIYKYKVISEVSLKQGARDLFGAEQIIVHDILERPNGISVIICEKKINLLFDRSVKKRSQYDFVENMYSDYKHIYLIVNKNRKEAFLPEVGGNFYTDMTAVYGPTRLGAQAKQFDFTYINDRSGPLPKINKEWLVGAKLVRVDAVKIGTQRTDFKIKDFSLPSQSTEANPKIDVLGRQLRQSDKETKRQMEKREIEF